MQITKKIMVSISWLNQLTMILPWISLIQCQNNKYSTFINTINSRTNLKDHSTSTKPKDIQVYPWENWRSQEENQRLWISQSVMSSTPRAIEHHQRWVQAFTKVLKIIKWSKIRINRSQAILGLRYCRKNNHHSKLNFHRLGLGRLIDKGWILI